MFRKLWLDAILGTIFILFFIWTIDTVTSLEVFDIFDPIGVALNDVKLTDVVYSQIREPLPPDESIVIINIGEMPRAGVGEIINIVNKYEPAVIGLYETYHSSYDAFEDSLLEVSLAGTKNLVMASSLFGYNVEADKFDSLTTPLPSFSQHASLGFSNLGDKDGSSLRNTREFMVHQEVNGQKQYAFAVQLAQKYDPAKAQKFLDRGKEIEVINYRGNVVDFGGSRFGTMFYALDIGQVFMEDFDPELLKDKIVLLCYLGKELGDELTREDKYYTPMNPKFGGKSNPDMFAGVIHANITAMILNEDYIDRMSSRQSIILAIIILFINVTLFSIVYKTLPIWYDAITKLTQIIEVIFLMYLTIQFFDSYNYELDLTLTIIAVALAGDSLEVYYGVIKNVFTSYGRRDLKRFKSIK